MQKELLFTELVYCIASTLPTTYESSVEAGNVTASRAFRYTYDNRGNITAVYDTSTTPEALLARYAYDEAGQLVREDNAELNKTVTYTYDKGGNITQKVVYAFTLGTPGTATDTIAYTYDSTWKDQLAAYDGTDIDYDEIGNPWGYTNDRYFMWQGRELRFFDTDDGYVEYRYNENGLRCRKTFTDYVTELDDVYDYYWTDDCRLLGYTVTMAGSTEPYSVLVLYNSAQEPIGFTVGEHTYYYIKNIQGDVLCVTDDAGTPIVRYTYDAWGAMTITPATQNVNHTDLLYVSMLNPVTYRGYFYDYELGLYYLQSRYYDPETGRFISARSDLDSFTGCNSTNLFLYDEIWIEKENAEVLAYEKKQDAILSESSVVASGEDPNDKVNTIIVNCYSRGHARFAHADITIDGVVYSYGNYAKSGISFRKQLLGKADGYIIWAEQGDWYQSEKQKGRKRTSFSFKVTEEVKFEILEFYSELFRCSSFDRDVYDI